MVLGKNMDSMISVAMATYNGQKYIEGQLLSIINQTQQIDEIIIVDDKSSDDTVKIIKKFIIENNAYNIVLIQNDENLGYRRNFKKAMSIAKGDYVFLCDQDDIWEKNKVEEMIKLISANPQILVLASSFVLIDGKSNIIGSDSNNNHGLYIRKVKKETMVSVPFNDMLKHNAFQGCSLVIRKSINILFQSCFTDEIYHDSLINLLASMQNGLYFYNKELFRYRIHEGNAVGINKSENYDELYNRCIFANNIVNNLNILEKILPEFCQYQPDYKAKRNFCIEHLNYLKKKNFLKLLHQNFNPYYHLVKGYKARIGDLLYVLRGK